MLSSFPNPVTAENFPAAWRYADRKLRWAKKKNLVSRVTVSFAQPIFAAVLVVLAYGLLFENGGNLVNLYLGQLPPIVQAWERIQTFLYQSADTTLQKGLVWAVCLYLLPFAVAAAFTLLILLVYHPQRRSIDPGDDAAEQARQLCLTLRDAKAKSRPPLSNTATFCNVCFAMIWGVLLFGFILFCLQNPEAKELIERQAHTTSVVLAVVFFALLFGYKLICLPLTLLLRLLAHNSVPKYALEESERWFFQCEQAREPSEAGITQTE